MARVVMYNDLGEVYKDLNPTIFVGVSLTGEDKYNREAQLDFVGNLQTVDVLHVMQILAALTAERVILNGKSTEKLLNRIIESITDGVNMIVEEHSGKSR